MHETYPNRAMITFREHAAEKNLAIKITLVEG